jgi:hypothetical protein
MRIFAAAAAEQAAARLEKRAHDGADQSVLSESLTQLRQQVTRVEFELRQFLAKQ